MRKRRLSKRRVLLELRRLLSRPDTQIVQRKLPICGSVEWVQSDDGPHSIVIRLDPRRDGRVSLVVHELLHVFMGALDELLDAEMHEAAILAWEEVLYSWLHAPAQSQVLESWNKAIERKMR